MASETQLNRSVQKLAAQTMSTMEPVSSSSALIQALPSAFDNKLPSRTPKRTRALKDSEAQTRRKCARLISKPISASPGA